MTEILSPKRRENSAIDNGAPDEETDMYGREEDEDVSALTTGQSPRYEAYLMTGDKILRLNSKISPNYAKVKQAELPKHVQVLDSPPPLYRGPFADLDRAKNEQRRSKSKLRPNQNPNFDHQSQQQKLSSHHSENGLTTSSSDDAKTCDSIATKSILTTISNALQDDKKLSSDVNENRRRGDREPSLVTVHGAYYSKATVSEATTDNHSRVTLQTVGAGEDLPSPVSPTYFSEPVSPARFAFSGVDDQQPKLRFRNGNEKNFTKTDVNGQQQNGKNTLIINVSQFSATPVDGQANATSIFVPQQNDSDSPGSSVQSTPLKEKLQQRFDGSKTHQLASQSSSMTKENEADAVKRLAKRLYALEGFKKSDVVKHLVKNNEFSSLVAQEYVKQFNLAGLRVDAALRKFLHRFTLTGETSEREKVIIFFSKRYHECNPGLFNDDDEVHTLTCALLLLNTDLHGQNVPKRMSCHDFIENLSQAGYSFPRDLLRSLYQSIKGHPIEWASDQSETDTSASGLSNRGGFTDARFIEMPDPDSQVEYKKGWVMRKCVIDEDGKKMPFGRRSWRMLYATLKGMVLYLHKDEHGFKKSSYQTFRNAIRIHHALASRASDYIKKQHVFRLHTAGLAEYLFQTSDPQEMQSWIESMNFVAACFSAPVLPPAVSARQSFHRPLLPSSPTKLSMREQCNAHEGRVKDLEKMLDQHRYTAPTRTAKPRQLQEYAEKEVFLLFDLQKYSTYAQILNSRLEEHYDRTTSVDMQTSMTDSEITHYGECDTNGGNGNFGAGHLPGVSGQSDRLSYRAAIASTMGTNSLYETNL